MAQFVPKAKLFEQLTQIIDQRETGLLTILTESNRSIFLRFSQGKLTRLHCRSGEAGEAIQMLAESAMVKYTYATAPQDSEPEFMPADSFLQLIDPTWWPATRSRRRCWKSPPSTWAWSPK
jgi:hypothetical protein